MLALLQQLLNSVNPADVIFKKPPRQFLSLYSNNTLVHSTLALYLQFKVLIPIFFYCQDIESSI